MTNRNGRPDLSGRPFLLVNAGLAGVPARAVCVAGCRADYLTLAILASVRQTS